MPITSPVTCEICGRDGDAPCECQQNSLLGFLSDFRSAAAPSAVAAPVPPEPEVHRAEAMMAAVAPPAARDYTAPTAPPSPPAPPAPSRPSHTYEPTAATLPPPPPPPPPPPAGTRYPPPGAPGAYPSAPWPPQEIATYGSPGAYVNYEMDRPSLGRRLMSGWTPIGILAAVAVVLVAAAVLLPRSSSGPSLKGKSPAVILQTTLSAATKAQTFHIAGQDVLSSETQVLQGDVSPSGGSLALTVGSDTFDVKVVGQTEYFKANAGYYRDAEGASPAVAARLGGQWVSSPVSGNSDFGQTGQMLETQTIIADFLSLTGTISEVSSTKDTVTLTGTVPSNALTQNSGAGDLAQLVVSARSPFLPVSISYSDPTSGSSQLNFSTWTESVPQVAPTSAIPLSSLAGSNPAPAAAVGAQANVRNALTAEFTYYTNNQAFDTTAAPNGVQQLESALQFTTTGPVKPGRQILLKADHDAAVMTAAGIDGNCYTAEATTVGNFFYQARGTGSGAGTTCSSPSKLVESLPEPPTNHSAAAAPGTWSLGF